MRRLVSGFAGIIMLVLFVPPAHPADLFKIGVVDLRRVATKSRAGDEIQAELKAKAREMEKDIGSLQMEIEQLEKKLKLGSMVMSDEKRAEKKRELNIMRYDLSHKQRKYQTELGDLEYQLLNEMQKEIYELAEKIGKKKGYLVIVPKNFVIFCRNSIDLTDQFISRYNERHLNVKGQTALQH